MASVNIKDLTGGIFQSSNVVSGITAFNDPLQYYEIKVLGASSPKIETRIRSAIVMALLRQRNGEQTPDSPENALAYILTGSFLLFPELATYMKGNKSGKYVPELTSVSASEFESRFLASMDEDNEEATDNDGSSATPLSFTLPSMGLEIGVQDWSAEPREVAARWGLEMFPIGKNVALSNIEGFRSNRIGSIKGVYTVLDETSTAFEDDVLPTLEVLKSVERAFNLYPAVRLSYADFWIARVLTGPQSMMQDAFIVVFKMTDNFGFSAPGFIMDFLNAYPMVAEYAELKPSVVKFYDAVNSYLNEDVRTRGFLKVRFGAKHRLFATSSRGTLLAAAVAYKSQTEESAKNFFDVTPFIPQLRRLNDFFKSKGATQITLSGTSTSTTAVIDA